MELDRRNLPVVVTTFPFSGVEENDAAFGEEWPDPVRQPPQ
jgi:hypothetical protein